MVELSRRRLIFGAAAVAVASSVPALAKPAVKVVPLAYQPPSIPDFGLNQNYTDFLNELRSGLIRWKFYMAGECNDAFTRARTREFFDMYLRQARAYRIIYDHMFVCDETNNPPDLIDSYGLATGVWLRPFKKIATDEIHTKIENGVISQDLFVVPDNPVEYIKLNFVNGEFV